MENQALGSFTALPDEADPRDRSVSHSRKANGELQVGAVVRVYLV